MANEEPSLLGPGERQIALFAEGGCAELIEGGPPAGGIAELGERREAFVIEGREDLAVVAKDVIFSIFWENT